MFLAVGVSMALEGENAISGNLFGVKKLQDRQVAIYIEGLNWTFTRATRMKKLAAGILPSQLQQSKTPEQHFGLSSLPRSHGFCFAGAKFGSLLAVIQKRMASFLEMNSTTLVLSSPF